MQNVVIGDGLFVFKMHAKMHLMVVKVILWLQLLLRHTNSIYLLQWNFYADGRKSWRMGQSFYKERVFFVFDEWTDRWSVSLVALIGNQEGNTDSNKHYTSRYKKCIGAPRTIGWNSKTDATAELESRCKQASNTTNDSVNRNIAVAATSVWMKISPEIIVSWRYLSIEKLAYYQKEGQQCYYFVHFPDIEKSKITTQISDMNDLHHW